jgi:hypothetical protein
VTQKLSGTYSTADLPFFIVFIAFKISSDLISTLTHHLSYLHLVNFLNALAFEQYYHEIHYLGQISSH